MPPGSEEAMIPKWASDLAVGVAEIKGKTDQIPGIVQELKEVKATMVPRSEHLKLLQDVENLKERDLSARGNWEEMVHRVPILWDERTQQRGAMAFLRVMVAVLGAIVVALTAWTLAHNAGIRITP